MAGGIGVQFSGLREARQRLGDLQAAVGTATRARIGVTVSVGYWHWIEFGFYRGGRPGRLKTRPGGYRYAEAGLAAVRPKVAPAIGKALPEGPEAVSAAAEALSGELAAAMRAAQPNVSGRLRRQTTPFRGGGLRGLP